MTMSQQQRKYALGRVDAIVAVKTRELRDKHTTPGRTLGNAERLKLLKDGTVKVRAGLTGVEGYKHIDDVFDFSKWHYGAHLDVKPFESVMARFTARANTARDQIMLGDAEEALAILAELEAA